MSSSVLVFPSRQGLLADERHRGVSPEADALRRQGDLVREQCLRSLTFGGPATAARLSLELARASASVDNWDGYGARRIEPGAYLQAIDFIGALSTTTPVPDVSVDPDGEVSFEWSFGPRHLLTVSVNRDGRLAFSGLFGLTKLRGTEWLVDGVPRSISDALGRLVAMVNKPPTAAAR